MYASARLALLTLCCLSVCASTREAFSALSPPHTLTLSEGFHEPIGFYDPQPTFSWRLPADGDAKQQSAYRIVVGMSAEDLPGTAEYWDTGKVSSDQSVFVPYGGKTLVSRDAAYWQVKYWDAQGNESAWSQPARFELGLLNNSDWHAAWIRPDVKGDANEERVALLRRDFTATENVMQARLYVTAKGLYEVYLNGKKVGNDAFTPGWTSYANRIDTQTYDVTEEIQTGSNTLGAALGYGWYAGRMGWKDQRHFYGKVPELLAQLELTYQDGRKERIVTDESWTATLNGPIRASSIYDGETYDACKELPGWNKAGYNNSAWDPVVANKELGTAKLTPKPFAPVQITETVDTQKITEPEPGRFVLDLGQNIVGWPLIKIPVEKNQTITVRFAEMLNQDGSHYTENYRSAKSIDAYTAANSGTISWKPTFTFHGFRYVELSGLPKGAVPKPDWVQGLVLHTNLERIGTFESSHKKLNQLQSNITWGQRGNFLDIPTDCPQRDERCGWTGDAQAFCPTAMFNYDCHAFWKSWLRSMRDDQSNDGRIPHVIPDILKNRGGSPGWMDAATIVPWEVYVRTGDRGVLSENYAMMEQLLGWYRKRRKAGVVEKVVGFGDWLQPYADDNKGDTPHNLLATAFYANSVQILADSAHVLGKKSDFDRYSAEADAVKQAFAAHFFASNGKIQNAPETQTAYILAIAFELIPDELHAQAAAHLVHLIDEAEGHLRTGFLGTPHLARVLDRTGNSDLAYSVLFKETYPSWFFSINQGATTMWERWNSYSHEDGFGNAAMNSFNHYAYGAIGQWMYERIAGLAPDPARPGYKHFFLQPNPGGPLDSASASLETHYGQASCGWKKQADKLVVTAVVPPNTTATFIPPRTTEATPSVRRDTSEKKLITMDGGQTYLLSPGRHRMIVE